MGLLIDSTVFIRAERDRHTPTELISILLDRFGDQDLALSVMSAGELFHGCRRADTPRRRARREEFVEAVVAAIPWWRGTASDLGFVDREYRALER
jgi:predicted nucleic acid-binding protein